MRRKRSPAGDSSEVRAPALLKRLRVVFAAVAVLALGVVGRAVQLQWVGDARLDALAKKQFESKVLLKPKRGLILDRNGEPFAVNIETQSLAANPSYFVPKEKSQSQAKGARALHEERRRLVRALHRALGISEHELTRRLTSGRDFAWIYRHLPNEKLERLRAAGLLGREGESSQALWLVREQRRAYPHAESAAHVVGSVSVDLEGLEGIELGLNPKLKGKLAAFDSVRDALGRPTFIDAKAESRVKEGENVRLTLDASLQFAVEAALRETAQQYRAVGGTVIVMDAKSGEILALANQPGFDPNTRRTSGAHRPENRRNRAVTDAFEPGSTMKPILMASALSNGWRTDELIWGGLGQFSIQGHQITEAESHEKFSWLTLKRVVEVSSNIGAAKAALKLGAKPYVSTLRSLGFGARTGLTFPGEVPGRLQGLGQSQAVSRIQPIELATMGFGHGLMATPIQMTSAYATLLNGGWSVKPRLILGEERAAADAPRRIFTSQVTDAVIDALRAAVGNEGTGKKARLSGYDVAGKTGTSQMLEPGTKRYSKSRYYASFIGFALGVEPKLVIYAGVEAPQGAYYGGDVAAPLFRKALHAATVRFGMPADPRFMTPDTQDSPSAPDSVLAHSGGGVQYPPVLPLQRRSDSQPLEGDLPRKEIVDSVLTSQASAEFVRVEGGGTRKWIVPSLVGMTSRQALRVIEGHRLKLKITGAGVVRRQEPQPGAEIEEGATLRLQLGGS